jgi:hypothetical protein
LVLSAFGKIFNMIVKEYMDDVEGEEVARQAEHNRESTQIATNFWERDRLGRCEVRLAPRFGMKHMGRDVVGGTPTNGGRDDRAPQ